jgi:cold-inducible RNA-binding protein
MGTKLYVGNLPFVSDEAALLEIFGQVGAVTSAQIIMNKKTGRPKGFAFVEMGSESAAQAAIERFHGGDYLGRTISVQLAKAPVQGTEAQTESAQTASAE